MADETPRSLLDRVMRPGPSRDHMPLAATGRAGRNLPAAVATAVVLIGAFALALWLWRPGFVALVVLLALGATWELGGAFARVGVTLAMPPIYVGTIGILVCTWTLGLEAALIAMYLTVFVVIAWRLLEGPADDRIRDVVTSIFAVVYVPFLASFVVLMLTGDRSPWWVVVFIVVTISNDIGGWAAGVLLGRHPMSPRISPKKSWEGFAGSVLMCVGVAVASLALLGAPWWWGPILGAAAAVVGTVGDLTESMIKREVGLKDMSNILPGHGGILDRLDSLLMTAPMFSLVLGLAMGG